LLGNTGFAKVDMNITPRNLLSVRVSTSRYSGENNVFLDPASPVTTYGISDNGVEHVATETATASLTSSLSWRMVSHLRAQFSRDLQWSESNSDLPLTRIPGILDGFGRSTILPHETREHRNGPNYTTTDMRLARKLYAKNGWKLEFTAESFNLFNHLNRRFQITDEGLMSNAAQFQFGTKHIGINYFPAYYRVPTNFLRATNAYAPRQVQFALRLGF